VIVVGIFSLLFGHIITGAVCLLSGVFLLSSFMYFLYRKSRQYFSATFPVFLFLILLSGIICSGAGLITLVEFGDHFTGAVCLLSGVFLILLVIFIKKKYKIKLPPRGGGPIGFYPGF